MDAGCKLCNDLSGNVCYRLKFAGIEILEPLPQEVVVSNESNLEKAAEDISKEIEAGTFNYMKWFPNGTLLTSIEKSHSPDNGKYSPYLWALLKDRISNLESQQKLLDEELETAKACAGAFLGEGK